MSRSFDKAMLNGYISGDTRTTLQTLVDDLAKATVGLNEVLRDEGEPATKLYYLWTSKFHVLGY